MGVSASNTDAVTTEADDSRVIVRGDVGRNKIAQVGQARNDTFGAVFRNDSVGDKGWLEEEGKVQDRVT